MGTGFPYFCISGVAPSVADPPDATWGNSLFALSVKTAVTFEPMVPYKSYSGFVLSLC